MPDISNFTTSDQLLKIYEGKSYDIGDVTLKFKKIKFGNFRLLMDILQVMNIMTKDTESKHQLAMITLWSATFYLALDIKNPIEKPVFDHGLKYHQNIINYAESCQDYFCNLFEKADIDPLIGLSEMMLSLIPSL